MYNLIPIILIIISLLSIIVIVGRKFSILAHLDVDNIPDKKGSLFKERLLGDRIKRNTSRLTGTTTKIIGRFSSGLKDHFDLVNKRIKEKRRKYSEEISTKQQTPDNNIKKLFWEIKDLDWNADFSVIEEKLINIIGLDSKNIEAFDKLGELYFDNKKFNEAKETYAHILRLLDDGAQDKQAEAHFDLALTNKELEENEQALKDIKQALSISPSNPRYLDTMFELSIILKDKSSAFDAYKKLEEVNPENQKLAEFKSQLDSI